MIQQQRVLFNDDGTEIDISKTVNDYRTSSYVLPFVAVDDVIYIASEMPFNHRFIDVSVVNDQASVASVAIWYNNDWVDAVDVIDGTSVGGKTLAQSGVLQWKTNRLKGWNREDDSENVSGVDAIGIYSAYWIRIVLNGDLKATTAIKSITQKFSDDTALFSQYPDLNNTSLMDAFQTSKTNWNDQHFNAAEIIIRDLKKRNLIFSSDQILDYEMFQDAGIHKTASIIYKGLGRSWVEARQESERDYIAAMNKNYYNIDMNQNANLDETEKRVSIRYATR